VSLDKELRELPLASPGKRLGVYFLDRLIVLAFGVIAGFPAYLISQGISNQSIAIAIAIQSVAILGGVIFAAMQGVYFRVGDTGQTVGMSLMGVAMASDTAQFNSKFLNRIFAWAHLDAKDKENSWGGGENEGRSDAQLWRGLLPWIVFPLSFPLVAVFVRILVGIPFVLASWWSGDFNLYAVNDVVFYVIVFPVAFVFVLTSLGFLFCLGKDKRTLVDHFLSIKLVDTTGSKFHYKRANARSFLTWFSGSDFSTIATNEQELVEQGSR
jgi:hypothetical protein